MPKSTNAAYTGGGKKWVVKGAEPAEAPPKTGKATEKDTTAAEDAAVAKKVDPEAGPVYDRNEMLRLFAKKKDAQPGGNVESDDGPRLDRSFSLSERPGGEPPEAESPSEQRKAARAAKRAASGENLGRSLSLSQGLEDKPDGFDAFMQMYLQSMYAPMQAMGAPGLTTVMLRNIPNRYTRDLLIEQLNKQFQGEFDFVYLPIDFNSKCNVGYAFINFRTPTASAKFVRTYHNQKTTLVLPGPTSNKVTEVSYARVQGRDANMENLRNEKFIEKLTEKPEWQPLFYDEDGEEISFSKLLEERASSPKHGARKSRRSDGLVPPAFGAGYPMMPAFGPGMYPMGIPPPSSTVIPPKATGKGKGKGKGKTKGADKGKVPAFGYMPVPPHLAFPGMPPVNPAYAAVMAQAAHAHAKAAAAARAGKGGSKGGNKGESSDATGLLDALAAAVDPKTKPLEGDNRKLLKKQIEFYFSNDNLCKDLYLRSHMAADGWTPVELVARFPQVRKYKASEADIVEVLKDSGLLEVNAETNQMRLRDEEMREKWAKVPSNIRQAAVSA